MRVQLTYNHPSSLLQQLQTLCQLRSGQAQKLKRLHFTHVCCRKSPFCREVHHGNYAIVTGKDCKTNYQAVVAVLIDNCLYRTTQYVKVYNILVYLRGYLSYNNFSHRTPNTLALQCSGTNLKQSDKWKPFKFCT